ncbi:hypothetical protein A6769_37985 [Nostoc punctiforme NIES-2108]|uniref:Uncharacterized protein n=1 Tax=Nostoc punctiforme NIES-2108 TaxID=1356359 RepID=A0A367R6D0_NOSPU|nr:hypothetical protein A6769_28790 [Nostoc punctiforme NIES-2108]RCJ42105.1 hypothetical protein A6769_37985 [Nostoc punctiforme NIES-2108]
MEFVQMQNLPEGQSAELAVAGEAMPTAVTREVSASSSVRAGRAVWRGRSEAAALLSADVMGRSFIGFSI